MSIRRALRLTRHVILVDHTRRSFPDYEAYELLPRRMPAAAVIGVLMLGGAVGTYFAVAGGLNVLLTGDTAGPDLRPAPVPAAVQSPTPAAPATTVSPTATPSASPYASAARRDSAPRRPPPSRPTRTPTPSPTCVCTPRPTPTTPPPSPPPPTVSPTATGSPSPPVPTVGT